MYMFIRTIALIVFVGMSFFGGISFLSGMPIAQAASPSMTPSLMPASSPASLPSSKVTPFKTTRILFLGDSLTEGLGVDAEHAYPSVLENKLNQAGYAVNSINGGISGATSASGFKRLQWHLKKPIDIIVLQLGANDGLRGLNIADTQKNLADIIQLAQHRQIKILLLGLRMPPNYGQSYTDDFQNMYVQLGNTYKIPTLPAFLTGVEGVTTLNQADGIHPNIQGHEVIAHHMYAFIASALDTINAQVINKQH